MADQCPWECIALGTTGGQSDSLRLCGGGSDSGSKVQGRLCPVTAAGEAEAVTPGLALQCGDMEALASRGPRAVVPGRAASKGMQIAQQGLGTARCAL